MTFAQKLTLHNIALLLIQISSGLYISD